MNKYIAILKAKSYTMIPKNIAELSFNISSVDYQISVKPISSFKNDKIGEQFSNELIIEVEIECKDFESAFGYVYQNTNVILDQLAFISCMPIEEAQFHKIYEITEGIESRRITQFFYNMIERIGSKQINLDILEPIVTKINTFSHKEKQRINRAIHWFNKALREVDSLDRLTYIWSGLESINPLFAKKFDVVETTTCVQCGFERSLMGTAPLKNFFEKIIKNPEVYSKTRRARNQILHGFEDLNKIRLKVEEFEDDLLYSFDLAIQFLLGVDRTSIVQPNIAHANEVVIVGHMSIENIHVEDFEPNIDLEIELEIVDGEIVIRPIFDINFSKFTFGGLGWDIYGEPGYDIKKEQIVIRDNSNS